MLGFEIRLYEPSGRLITDTEAAINSLSPLVKNRIMAISRQRSQDDTSKFLPYELFIGGKEIGRLEIRFLPPKKENVFIQRSNRLLMLSLMALGGIAIILSVIF